MNYVFRFALVAASARLLWAYPMAVTDSRLLGFNTSHFVREIENIEGRQLLGGGLGLESTQTQTSTQTPTSIATRTLTLTQSTSTSTLATSNSFSHSPRTNAGTISAGVIGGVLVTAFVIALLFWLRIKRKVSQPGAQTLSQASGREKLPSSPPSIKSLAPEQVASEPSQNHFDSGDIPTSSTSPRARNGRSPMSNPFANDSTYWGQVGQYYHGTGEL